MQMRPSQFPPISIRGKSIVAKVTTKSCEVGSHRKCEHTIRVVILNDVHVSRASLKITTLHVAQFRSQLKYDPASQNVAVTLTTLLSPCS